jgi:omega-amidase
VANLDRLRGLLGPLSGSDGRLLVLPEMMSTGFTDDLDSLVEPAGGSWEQDFHQLIAKIRLPSILGIARREGSEITNEALFFDAVNAQPQASYRKIRPFKSEHKVVTPGKQVSTFEYQGVTFCPLICYDLRFPELFRAGLRQGAEVFLVIASWPDRRQMHWETLLQARAIENQAFMVGVNRCGDDPELHYAGGSMVVDPHGNVIYHAGDSESITAVPIDVQMVRDWRSEFPGVSDYLRSPDLA